MQSFIFPTRTWYLTKLSKWRSFNNLKIIIIAGLLLISPASVIGKGGFGEVHKALYHGTTVAVKVFSSHSAEMHNTTVHQLIRQEVSSKH